MRMDRYDRAKRDALQRDGALTNAGLSERVNLSASQRSRRRAVLETAGLIEGYATRLDAAKFGFGLSAMVRAVLKDHGKGADAEVARFVETAAEIGSVLSVSGDADDVLDIRVHDLEAFAEVVHSRLLPHPMVSQLRSEIVLRTLKDRKGGSHLGR